MENKEQKELDEFRRTGVAYYNKEDANFVEKTFEQEKQNNEKKQDR